MCASAYLNDKFFCHIRTTSQCEGVNSLIKSYVWKKNNLLDFMQKFHQALREYQNNQLIVEFNCMFTSPILTTCLQEIKKYAIKVFTRDIFTEMKSETEDARAANMIERSKIADNVVLKMNRFGKLNNE